MEEFEPSAKRPRAATEESNNDKRYRSIRLDMAKYDQWVRDLSDEGLVSMFELGVKVKESVIFTMDVNQEFMEKALSSQLQPVRKTVEDIEKEVKQQVQTVQESVSRDVTKQLNKMSEEVHELKVNLRDDINGALSPKMKQIQDTMGNIEGQVNKQVLKLQADVTNSVCGNVKEMTKNVLGFKDELSNNIKSIGNKLEQDVKNVTAKVPPLDSMTNAIKDSEERIRAGIRDALGEHKKQLDEIHAALANPSKKGARAERNVLDILNQNLRSSNFTFVNITSERGKGDIEAQSPYGHKIMIEVKDHKNAVSKGVIESFEGNLSKSDFKVGILLSMSSGIAMRSKGSQFEVTFSQEKRQHQIYVPNAYVNKEDHLIVWSVVMAAELAKVEVGDLGERKTQKLKEIFNEFQQNEQRSKDCREILVALENTMKDLKENIVPILDTIEKTSSKISKLLHSTNQ